jgi:hypothetical protein
VKLLLTAQPRLLCTPGPPQPPASNVHGTLSDVAGGKAQLRDLHATDQLHTFALHAYRHGHAATETPRWLASDEAYNVTYQVNYEPWFVMSRSAELQWADGGTARPTQMASGVLCAAGPSAQLTMCAFAATGGTKLHRYGGFPVGISLCSHEGQQRLSVFRPRAELHGLYVSCLHVKLTWTLSTSPMQVALVAYTNFTFSVLPDAWLVHRPHAASSGQRLYNSKAKAADGTEAEEEVRSPTGALDRAKCVWPRSPRRLPFPPQTREWRGSRAPLSRLFHRRVSALRHVTIRDMKRRTYAPVLDSQVLGCRLALPWWSGSATSMNA